MSQTLIFDEAINNFSHINNVSTYRDHRAPDPTLDVLLQEVYGTKIPLWSLIHPLAMGSFKMKQQNKRPHLD